MGSPLKGKNLLLQEQILTLKRRFHFGHAWLTIRANRNSQKLFPFVKVAKNKEVYSYTLSLNLVNKQIEKILIRLLL